VVIKKNYFSIVTKNLYLIAGHHWASYRWTLSL